MSNLIQLVENTAKIVENTWLTVQLPASNVEARKQAGKVVLFKLTGEETVTESQIAETVIPSTGKVIVPLSVFIARKDTLLPRIENGEIELNISGCMNACGHHHVGHIGILGVDKDSAEFYQVSIGGKQGNDASIGAVIGPSFAADEMPSVIQKLIDVYIKERTDEERFIDTVRRLGVAPFKAYVYAKEEAAV